jgi:hypothetical protein
MNRKMKQHYRLFRRGWGVFYFEDLRTGKQHSLKTRNRNEAYRLMAAKNEAEEGTGFAMQLARVYWNMADPLGASRTWQLVMDEIPKLKQGSTRERWLTAVRDKALNPLRARVVLETRPEDFLKVLESGSVSTNSYLRRIHRFALDMNWLPWPVLPLRRWPALKHRPKRAITREEHQKILAGESNSEWHDYYELLWHLGGAQTDIATLSVGDIDWNERTISYDTNQITPLHWAARKGHEKMAEALLAAGADVNAKAQNRFTALHCAGRL